MEYDSGRLYSPIQFGLPKHRCGLPKEPIVRLSIKRVI